MISKAEFSAAFSSDLPGNSSNSNSIYFEHLNMDGLEEMHRYSSDPRFYEFFEYGVFSDISETKMYISKLLNRMSGEQDSRNAVYWFVRRRSDDFLIGTACLVSLDYPRKSIEWGYGVDPDLWGNGYVLKIQEDLKTYAFETLGLNRLYGITMVNNKRTIESVIASGAKHEGICRDHYCKDGVFIDGWQYSILAKDHFAERESSGSETTVSSKDIITVLTDLLPQESIGMDTAMENTASWDSLTHMTLMIELKERFGIDFAPSDIAEAISVDAIIALIHDKRDINFE